MKPEPTPKQPSEWEKFLAFTKKVVSVPKSEIDRRERAYKAERKRLKRGKA